MPPLQPSLASLDPRAQLQLQQLRASLSLTSPHSHHHSHPRSHPAPQLLSSLPQHFPTASSPSFLTSPPPVHSRPHHPSLPSVSTSLPFPSHSSRSSPHSHASSPASTPHSHSPHSSLPSPSWYSSPAAFSSSSSPPPSQHPSFPSHFHPTRRPPPTPPPSFLPSHQPLHSALPHALKSPPPGAFASPPHSRAARHVEAQYSPLSSQSSAIAHAHHLLSFASSSAPPPQPPPHPRVSPTPGLGPPPGRAPRPDAWPGGFPPNGTHGVHLAPTPSSLKRKADEGLNGLHPLRNGEERKRKEGREGKEGKEGRERKRRKANATPTSNGSAHPTPPSSAVRALAPPPVPEQPRVHGNKLYSLPIPGGAPRALLPPTPLPAPLPAPPSIPAPAGPQPAVKAQPIAPPPVVPLGPVDESTASLPSLLPPPPAAPLAPRPQSPPFLLFRFPVVTRPAVTRLPRVPQAGKLRKYLVAEGGGAGVWCPPSPVSSEGSDGSGEGTPPMSVTAVSASLLRLYTLACSWPGGLHRWQDLLAVDRVELIK